MTTDEHTDFEHIHEGHHETADEVTANVQSQAKSLFASGLRLCGVNLLVELMLASYLLFSIDMSSHSHFLLRMIFFVVIMLAGLMACSLTVRVPLVVATRSAVRDPLRVGHEPSNSQVVTSVGLSSVAWIIPAAAATRDPLLAGALILGMLPVLLFVSNAVLRATLASWSGLPAALVVEHSAPGDIEDELNYD